MLITAFLIIDKEYYLIHQSFIMVASGCLRSAFVFSFVKIRLKSSACPWVHTRD